MGERLQWDIRLVRQEPDWRSIWLIGLLQERLRVDWPACVWGVGWGLRSQFEKRRRNHGLHPRQVVDGRFGSSGSHLRVLLGSWRFKRVRLPRHPLTESIPICREMSVMPSRWDSVKNLSMKIA